MDAVTQGLLGAVSSQVGLRNKLGSAAPWVAAGTAMLPDADLFVVPLMETLGIPAGPFGHLVYHRGVSHSLLAVPFLAGLVAVPWWLLQRKSFGWMYLCCLVAALTHPLLDWFTSYGTQLLAPLADRRYALHAVAVVDLIYSPILILTLVIAWRVRKRGRLRAATMVGLAGLVVSTGYLLGGVFARQVAIGRALAAYEGGSTEILRAEAYPQIGSIFVWRLAIEDADGWHTGRTHVLFDRPVSLRFHPSAEGPLVRQALEDPDVAVYRWFADDTVRPVVHRFNGRALVDLHDMRYGLEPEAGESLWLARVEFDERGRIVRVRHLHHRHWDHREAVRQAWLGMFRP